jgi:hypothetical protein
LAGKVNHHIGGKLSKFELRDNDSLGSNVIRYGIHNWKVVLAVVIAFAIPPLIPAFIAIGIYLILKDL